jgi:membrane protein DedA with SNARE-associated domain
MEGYMPDILSTIAKYGYWSLSAVLLMEAIGLPIPGALALLAAGAAAAAGVLHPALAFGAAIGAMLIGDTALYLAGRYSGWTLLGFLCGLSLSPEVCILRSAKWFYKRGRTTLLFAKFLPGVNTMAPPLAGSMHMRASQFLRFDLGGVLLYTLAYGGLGYLFRDVFRLIAGGMQAFSRAVGWVIFVGVIAFVCYRAWLYGRHRLNRFVRRVPVGDVAARLKLEGAPDIIIADVRSHGYYDQGEQRVQGSIRIEPNNLDAFIEALPKDTAIYLYCT